MRIVFFGSADFAVESLKRILEAGYDVVAVVSSPDKPAGRGLKLRPTPVSSFAQQKGLAVFKPSNLEDPHFLQQLRELNPDLQVVVAFRYLPRQVWEIPRLGTINLHASYLPDYRGAAPINWAIVNGEQYTGVTTFFINDRIDTGNIILRQRIPINDTDTAGTLHDRLMKQGADLLVETIKLIEQGKAQVMDQKQLEHEFNSLHTAPKIFQENSRIDWTRPVRQVYDFIRGMSPYPGAWSVLEDRATGKRIDNVKIYWAEPIKQAHDLLPGQVITDYKSYMKVATPDGFIDVKEIQLPGKKRLNIEKFLRGFKMKAPFFE